MSVVSSLQYLSIKKSNDTHLKLDNSLFLMIIKEGIGNAAMFFNEADLTAVNIDDFFRKWDLEFSTSKKQSDLKIVGPSKLIYKLLSYINPKDFNDTPRVYRESVYEVIYMPSSFRLRVSKADDRASAQVINRPSNEKIKVLVVDDSTSMQKILKRMLESDTNIEVVGIAGRPSEVEDLIKSKRPDVITLDIHMPEMNGVELLKKIMPKYQIPTIMISSLSMEESSLVLDALESGATDYMQKPELDEMDRATDILTEKVKLAAKVNMAILSKGREILSKQINNTALSNQHLVVIGSSTGGTVALQNILTAMPKEIPPIMIVQHIPPVFSKAYADRLNELCPFQVSEAVDGEIIAPNHVYIAPGGKQMQLNKNGTVYRITINDDPPVNRFRPSVDYFFNTLLKNIKLPIIGIILTGMGKDGAKGLLELKNQGAITIAQDEESSVVFGMPKAAIELGAATYVESLCDIPRRLCELLSDKKNAKKKAS